MHADASSPTVSPRTSPEPEENLQIFVKNVTGITTTLSVPPTTSIATIKSLVNLRTSSANTPSPLSATTALQHSPPSSQTRLVYAGRHLRAPDSTLADHHIPTNSVLHLALPLRGGMAPKKMRCAFKDCKEKAQPITGACSFCEGVYCGKHRLLESHSCEGLEDCKKESKERNAEKLNTERTQMVRGV